MKFLLDDLFNVFWSGLPYHGQESIMKPIENLFYYLIDQLIMIISSNGKFFISNLRCVQSF